MGPPLIISGRLIPVGIIAERSCRLKGAAALGEAIEVRSMSTSVGLPAVSGVELPVGVSQRDKDLRNRKIAL